MCEPTPAARICNTVSRAPHKRSENIIKACALKYGLTTSLTPTFQHHDWMLQGGLVQAESLPKVKFLKQTNVHFRSNAENAQHIIKYFRFFFIWKCFHVESHRNDPAIINDLEIVLLKYHCSVHVRNIVTDLYYERRVSVASSLGEDTNHLCTSSQAVFEPFCRYPYLWPRTAWMPLLDIPETLKIGYVTFADENSMTPSPFPVLRRTRFT